VLGPGRALPISWQLLFFDNRATCQTTFRWRGVREVFLKIDCTSVVLQLLPKLLLLFCNCGLQLRVCIWFALGLRIVFCNWALRLFFEIVFCSCTLQPCLAVVCGKCVFQSWFVNVFCRVALQCLHFATAFCTRACANWRCNRVLQL